VDGPPPPSAVTVDDLGDWQGEWEVVSWIVMGRDKAAVYKGGRLVFVGPSARVIETTTGRIFSSTTLRVDAAACPATIDERCESGRRRLGIYRRVGDELLWADANPGEPRPSSFEPADGVLLWMLRHVKK
jgi:uncharacterized protein (TIGR03067 family)